MPDRPPRRRRRPLPEAKKRAGPPGPEVMIAVPETGPRPAPPPDKGKRVVYVETLELG